MFSEGYHGSHPETVVREDLCAEALRLASLLAAHPVTGAAGEVKGLLALMCLLAARLPARRDGRGDLDPARRAGPIPLGRGAERARAGGVGRSGAGAVSEMVLEAAIAAQHGLARSVESTDWPAIVTLYDRLAELRPSPVGRSTVRWRWGSRAGRRLVSPRLTPSRAWGGSTTICSWRRRAPICCGGPGARGRRCHTTGGRASWRATIRNAASSIVASASAAKAPVVAEPARLAKIVLLLGAVLVGCRGLRLPKE